MTHGLGNLVLSFLSHDWAGLVLASVVASLGISSVRVTRAKGAPRATAIGYAVLGIAGLLALGSIYHLIYVARVRSQYAPPGTLVDIGGYRLHVLAEGDARGKPTIVWMPGSHGGGFYVHHLHRMFRGEARSILIDRPGSGWSDIGPFPRTSAVESVEVIAALEKSGENGPFVLVGHSLGGLLVANIARRRPDLIAGIVLLDATPPDTINYAPPNPMLTRRRGPALWSATKRLFGLHPVMQPQPNPNPDMRRLDDIIAKQLGAAQEQVQAIEGAGTRAICAGASIFDELSPGGLGWHTSVYDGDLGNLPLFLVAPRDLNESEALMVAQLMGARPDANSSAYGVDTTRLLRFYARSRERYLAASSRSERIYSPAGTGHNFPYEAPETVVDAVRRMLLEHPHPPDVE